MTGPRFHRNSTGLTLGEIVSLTGAELQDGAMSGRRMTNVAPIDEAELADITFFDNAKFACDLASTRAGAVLISKRLQCHAPAGVTVLLTSNPYRSFTEVARALYPASLVPRSVFETVGVATNAAVHPSAEVAACATIDPGAVIGPRARIGAGALIGANAVIGPDVTIGESCSIGPGCTVTNAVLGDRVIIHPGCHIGQDGFGFIMGALGHLKVPQVGIVVIGNDVEIGAGTAIDRGGIRNTTIGDGTKIDNLVQIAHNVVIGRHCIIAGQSGLAGSVTLEDGVVLAARVGVRQHVTIGKGAQLAARSSVMRDVPPGAVWGGFPNAKPLRRFLREVVTIEQLAATASDGVALDGPTAEIIAALPVAKDTAAE